MSPGQYPFALLVIDVQQGLFKHTIPIYHAPELITNLQKLIDFSRQRGALVTIIQHSNNTFLKKDTPEWQLHASLEAQPGDLHVYKQHASSFERTDLRDELSNRGIQQVVICGLVTHGCVKATCLDALKHGYNTILISDAHSSYSKDAGKLVSEWNKKLEQAGALLCTTNQFVQPG